MPEGVQQVEQVVNIQHTETVIDTIRQKSDRVILFYSTGKDSIALLDMLSTKFKEVVCLLMYFVKGLEHIERYVNYSKAKYKNVTFIEIPHWNLTYVLREGIYCKADSSVKLKKLSDIVEIAKAKTGLEYCFLGMKQSDSLNRRLMLKGYELEAINYKSGSVYPLSKWSNLDVSAYIRLHKLPEPIRYSKQKKSQGMGFNLDVYLYLRQHYPNDLKKMIEAFPLSEQILFEYDRKQAEVQTK